MKVETDDILGTVFTLVIFCIQLRIITPLNILIRI